MFLSLGSTDLWWRLQAAGGSGSLRHLSCPWEVVHTQAGVQPSWSRACRRPMARWFPGVSPASQSMETPAHPRGGEGRNPGDGERGRNLGWGHFPRTPRIGDCWGGRLQVPGTVSLTPLQQRRQLPELGRAEPGGGGFAYLGYPPLGAGGPLPWP